MAKYKDLKGTNVQTFDTDVPTAYPSGLEGQIYYYAGQFKYIGLGAGAWASGGNLNGSRGAMAGAGTQTAALAFGGNRPGPTSAATESYDGTTWTEVNDLNTARNALPGSGTSTTAIACPGDDAPDPETQTETFNGTSWTEVGDINSKRARAAAGGTSAAAIFYSGDPPSGEPPPTQISVHTETYDGSTWTEVNNLNTGRHAPYGTGSSTATLCAGGYLGAPPGGNTVNVETWDGTSWTEGANLNTASGRGGASGPSILALAITGEDDSDYTAKTESWDGTSWTEVADVSTARSGGASTVGTQSSNTLALYAGGAPGPTAVTEEWTYSHAFKKVTIS